MTLVFEVFKVTARWAGMVLWVILACCLVFSLAVAVLGCLGLLGVYLLSAVAGLAWDPTFLETYFVGVAMAVVLWRATDIFKSVWTTILAEAKDNLRRKSQ